MLRADEPAPREFLARTVGFTADQIAAVERGEVAASPYQDAEKGELAARSGAVRVAAPA